MKTKYHHKLESILENILYYKELYSSGSSSSGGNGSGGSSGNMRRECSRTDDYDKEDIIDKMFKTNIEHKIFIVSQILDLFESKIYKFFPTKKLINIKKKLNYKLFNLYVYGCENY